ncbi:MAG: cytochrome c1 [Magnetovibrionaceae bacterium]
MLRKTLLAAAAAVAISFGATAPQTAQAAGAAVDLIEQDWSFEGIFGTYDRNAVRRGLQVYREVCSSCHGLKRIAFRHLAGVGFTEDEIKAIAAEYTIVDGPNDEGEMFERDGIPADYYPSPYPNPQAGAAAHGKFPPDLSLMAKARGNGPNYIYSILNGYVDEVPEGFPEDANYNEYFPGHQIAMAQPLYGDDVEYADGTEATISQQSKDLVQFLMWTASPELEERKSLGIKVILFLIVFTGLLYALKRQIWKDLH